MYPLLAPAVIWKLVVVVVPLTVRVDVGLLLPMPTLPFFKIVNASERLPAPLPLPTLNTLSVAAYVFVLLAVYEVPYIPIATSANDCVCMCEPMAIEAHPIALLLAPNTDAA
jgi:hypothetical protein